MTEKELKKRLEQLNKLKIHPRDLEENRLVLGDGYASASEMKYCGARYIFNQKIDITQIEQIEIIKYKISR